MNRVITITLCVAMFALSACKGKDQAPPPGEPPQAAQPQAPEPGEAITEANVDELDVKTKDEPETQIAEAEIPTPEDYEEEAAEKITVANFEAELEALEAYLQ